MAECGADLRNTLNEGALTEKKAFIRSHVKEIRITDDEAKLTARFRQRSAGIRRRRVRFQVSPVLVELGYQ